MKRSVAILCMCLMVGCGLRPKAIAPSAVFTNNFIADLSDPNLFTAYHALPDGPAKVDRRNQILTEELWLVDLAYGNFETGFYSNQAFIGMAGDIISIGTSTAGAVSGTAYMKSILAAVTGAAIGLQASYAKRVLDLATREMIVARMRADRLAALATIQEGMQNCATTTCPTGLAYTLEQGLMDVTAYYNSGTVIGALQSIAESTSQQSQAAKATLKALRRN
jgi:hypothetical protein